MNIFTLVGKVAINRAQAVKDIDVIKKSAKGASTAMKRSFSNFSGYVKKHSAQIKAAGRAMTVFGGIATAAFAVSVRSAAVFEEQLANVSTMLNEDAMYLLPEYRDALQNMSIEFGEATDTLSKGLYDILSASIDPAKALDVLEASSIAATAGLTDTGTAADAVTTVMNSYGYEAEDAGLITDKLFAIVKGGKCLTGDTRILLSDGRYKRIDSLSGEVEVISWDYRNFVPMKAKFVDMGTKQTVKIITKMGREIKTTPEHPYLTPDGWRKVEDLSTDDKIAVPSSLPFFGNIRPKDGWPELLGYLLAEGSIQNSSPRLAIDNPKILDNVKDAAKRYGINVKKINQNDKTKCGSYMLTAGIRDSKHKNSIIDKLREYDLWGKNCHTKFIPEEVFSWQRDDIAKLLNAYFNGDGWLSVGNSKKELGVCSVSKRLLEDVSHLLLRFGVNGSIRKNSNNAWVWTAKRYIEIKRFLDYIGIERDSVKQFLQYKPEGRGDYTTLTSYGKVPLKKKKYKPYNGVRNTDNQLYYDGIKEIIYEKEERVYDLVVPKLHNFVANDILAHNTTFGELAPAIGQAATTAAESGLDFDEFGAAISTCTRAGINTRETMTSVVGVLKAFLTPQDDAIEAAEKFGLTLNTTTLKTEGLTGVMEKLKDASAEELAQIFGNIRGLKGMMVALGDTEGYARDYALMIDSAGLAQAAFEKQSNTLSFQLKQLKQAFKVVQVEVGDALVPTIKKAVKWITETTGKVRDWIKENRPLFETLVKVAAGLSGVMLVLGPIMIILPGIIASLGLLQVAFIPFFVGGLVIAGLIKLNSLFDDMNEKVYKAQQNFDNISVAEIDTELESLATKIKNLKEQMKFASEQPLATSAQFGSLIDMQNAIDNYEMKIGLLMDKREELTKVEKEGADVTKQLAALDETALRLKEDLAKAMKEEKEAQVALAKAEELANKQKEIRNKIYGLENDAMKIARHDLELLKDEYIEFGVGQTEVDKWFNLEIEKLKELDPLYIAAKKAKEDLATAMEGVNRTIFEFKNSEYDVALQDVNDKYDDLEKQVKKANLSLVEEKEKLDEINKARKLLIEQIKKTEYERKKSQWVEYLKKVADSWSDVQIKMAGLGPVLDALGIKWRDMSKEAVQGGEDAELSWSEFFANMKNNIPTITSVLQDAAMKWKNTVQTALANAITSLLNWKEINDKVNADIATNEQARIDETLKYNETYHKKLEGLLSDFVDTKTLENATIEELEALMLKHMSEEWATMSGDAVTDIGDIDQKYDDLDSGIREDMVSLKSIWKTFWEELKTAAVTQLAAIIAQQAISALIAMGPVGWAILGIAFLAALASGYFSGGGEVEENKALAGFDTGGLIKGFAKGGGTDTQLIAATPGEYVVSKPMTDFIRRTGIVTSTLVDAIRSGARTPTPQYAMGGGVSGGFAGGGVIPSGGKNIKIEKFEVNIFAQELNDETIASAGGKMYKEFKRQLGMRGESLVED